jgi:hypothetical protein
LSKRHLLLPCVVILSAFALAACGGSGGGDEGEVEEVIETSATTTDPADCSKLQTQQFIEQISRESGKAAVEACEEEAENDEGADSASVSAVEVDGSSATAEAALVGGSLDGQTMEVELIKDGDQWKMNEVIKFTEFDQAKLVEVFEEGLLEDASEIDRGFARCIIDAFEQGSQAEVEDLVFGESPEALEEVFEVCSSRPSA